MELYLFLSQNKDPLWNARIIHEIYMCKIIRKADVHKVFNFSCNAKIKPLSFQKILLSRTNGCGFSFDASVIFYAIFLFDFVWI